MVTSKVPSALADDSHNHEHIAALIVLGRLFLKTHKVRKRRGWGTPGIVKGREIGDRGGM